MTASTKNFVGSLLSNTARVALVALMASGAGACVNLDEIHATPKDSMHGDDDGKDSDPHDHETDEPCDTHHPDTDGTHPADSTGDMPTGGPGESEGGGTEESGGEATGDPPTTLCGNGSLDPGEACDDGVNDGAYGGCLSGCAGLAAHCGDGTVNDMSEACDDGNTVEDDGCTQACQPSHCGDGVVQVGEACDGALAPEDSCAALGYAGGALGCISTTCVFDTSQCVSCGNGVIDADEVCDGGELGGASCETLGFPGGAITCNEKCSALDTSNCFPLPAADSCCTVGASGVCLDEAVTTCVCAELAGCCETEWSEACVDIATKLCGVACP